MLYINSTSTRLLKRYRSNLIEYKNQIFPNIPQINLRACDTELSYHRPYLITGSNIPEWDGILNCCSDFSRMNATYLESSKQLHCFFPDSHHKIKNHVFQNISKC